MRATLPRHYFSGDSACDTRAALWTRTGSKADGQASTPGRSCARNTTGGNGHWRCQLTAGGDPSTERAVRVPDCTTSGRGHDGSGSGRQAEYQDDPRTAPAIREVSLKVDRPPDNRLADAQHPVFWACDSFEPEPRIKAVSAEGPPRRWLSTGSGRRTRGRGCRRFGADVRLLLCPRRSGSHRSLRQLHTMCSSFSVFVTTQGLGVGSA